MCKLDIHGSPKIPTWSQLTATVNPGDSTMIIEDTDNNWYIFIIEFKNYEKSRQNNKKYLKFSLKSMEI